MAVVGIIWTVGGETSSDSSTSSDKQTVKTRHRRAFQRMKVTNAERLEWLVTHNEVRNDMTKRLFGHPQPPAAVMNRMVGRTLYLILIPVVTSLLNVITALFANALGVFVFEPRLKRLLCMDNGHYLACIE